MPDMMRLKDLRGKRFGRLLVKHFARMAHGHAEWCCICDCGSVVRARGTRLVQGKQVSCGCAKSDPAVRRDARLKTPAARRSQIASLGGAATASAGIRKNRPANCTMTLDQAALILECTRDAVAAMVQSGRIEHKEKGGRILVAARDVEALAKTTLRARNRCLKAKE